MTKIFGLEIRKSPNSPTVKIQNITPEVKTDIPDIVHKSASMTGYSAIINGGMSGNMPNSPRAYITKGYQENPNVYSVINLIARAASKARFKLIDKSKPDKEEEIKAHPLLDLLRSPNKSQSKHEFLENAVGFLMLIGECPIEIGKVAAGNNNGKPLELNVLPPQYIRIKLDNLNNIASFEYNDGDNKRVIDVEDMLFPVFWDPNGTVRGMSALMPARKLIMHDNAAIEANAKLLMNGGPKGILVWGGDSAQGGLSAESMKAAQSAYEEDYGNGENYGKIMMMGENMKFIELGSKIDDLGVFEGRVMSMRDICKIYNVSSQLLEDAENKTYNNMQEARKSLITNCVIPVVEKIIASFSRQLIPLYPDLNKAELCLDKSAWEELKEDMKMLVDALAAAWWMTPNEKRKSMGLEESDMPEANSMFIPSNLLPQPLEGGIDDLTGLHSGNKPTNPEPDETDPDEQEEAEEDESKE